MKDAWKSFAASCIAWSMSMIYISEPARAIDCRGEDYMEQRAARRKPVLWSGRLHRDGRVMECQTIHISAGGARIRISERFAINSTVLLVVDRVGAFPG